MIHKVLVPKSQLVNLSLTVPEDFVGEEMEVIAFLKKDGLRDSEAKAGLSPALPGEPLTNQQFLNWIKEAENMPTVSLGEAESKWAKQREKFC